MATVPVFRELPIVLASPWVLWEFQWDPLLPTLQLSAISLNNRGLLWLQDTGSIFSIIMSPYEGCLHTFQKVFTILASQPPHLSQLQSSLSTLFLSTLSVLTGSPDSQL